MYSAFPTEFIEWSDGYRWEGTLFDTAEDQCVQAPDEGSTTTFASFPQPPVTTPTRSPPEGTPDPGGLKFEVVPVLQGIQDVLRLMPDQDDGPLESCSEVTLTPTEPTPPEPTPTEPAPPEPTATEPATTAEPTATEPATTEPIPPEPTPTETEIGFVPKFRVKFIKRTMTVTVGGSGGRPPENTSETENSSPPHATSNSGPLPQPSRTSSRTSPQNTGRVSSKTTTGSTPAGGPQPSVSGNPPAPVATAGGPASSSFYNLAGYYNSRPFVSLLLMTTLLSTLVVGVMMLAGM